jgi:hypothetical protein
MTTMHPPVNRRCQIYSDATSVRCINQGTHWVTWGGVCVCTKSPCAKNPCASGFCEKDFYSWECDGHLFGDANSAAVPTQREAA